MSKKYIYSLLLGSIFFTVPYLACDISAVIASVLGVSAYGAGLLIFNDRRELKFSSNFKEEEIKSLEKAEKDIDRMKQIVEKLENPQIKKNVKKIYDVSNRIIKTIQKKPKKIKNIRNFLSYYLPVTIKILERYDEIENQDLATEETKNFMSSVEKMVEKIGLAFEEQLSNIYQVEIVDTNAELKVFEAMLKADGFSDEIDFKINKKEVEK